MPGASANGEKQLTAQGEPAEIVEPMDTSQNATDVIRSMALSSAELWHDVLARLAEVQEGQLLIAKAIADLGAVVGELQSARAAGELPAAGSATSLLALGAGSPEDVTADRPVDEDAVDVDGSVEDEASSEKKKPRRRRSFQLRRRSRSRDESVADEIEGSGVPPVVDEHADSHAEEPEPVVGAGAPVDPVPELVDEHDVTPVAPPVVTHTFAAPVPPAPETSAAPHEDGLDAPITLEALDASSAPSEDHGPATNGAHGTNGAHPLLDAPRALVYTPGGSDAAPVPAPAAAPAPVVEHGPVASPPPPAPAATYTPGSFRVEEHHVPEEPVELDHLVAEHDEMPVLATVGAPVQSSASIATEILATTAVSADAGSQGEPGPLVISEDVTLISKNRKRRQGFRLR